MYCPEATRRFRPQLSKRLLISLALLLCDGALHAQAPVNADATPEARSLLAFLHDVYGEKIISGQCNERWLPLIMQKTGEQPALLALDFDGVTPSQGGNDGAETAIDWVKNKGGIVQFQWHWISPNGDGDYYGSPVKFDLAAALANPEGQSYKNMIRDIDLVAAEIKKMQDEGVPLLWRPLHESEGKWFWWGMSGKDATIALYRLMYDRFTNHHKLNNIIWIWNSYGDNKGNWYPGDDVCDIIAYDYEEWDSWSDFQTLFGGKGKLFGLAEVGRLPAPEAFAQRPWSFFICWDYMIQDPAEPNIDPQGRGGKNATAWTQSVYSDPTTLNLDDLGPYDIYGRFIPLSAVAGPDQTVIIADGATASVQLDASSSRDRVGSISKYEWSTGDGTIIATGQNPTVELERGIHTVLLTTTSSLGNTATDIIVVRVKLPNLALDKPVSVSSTEATTGITGGKAVDGDPASRWASVSGVDPQWFYVDLQRVHYITDVLIDWEAASARDYRLEYSTNAAQWTTLATLSAMPNGAREDAFSDLAVFGRYVRMYGTARTSKWGYSFFEFEVNGVDASTPYTLWQRTSFSSGEIARGEAAPGFVVAGDGIPNLMKYALGCDDPHAPVPDAKMPALEVEATGEVYFTFPSIADGLTYSIEYSTNMVDWQDLPHASTPGLDRQRVRLAGPQAGGRIAARLKFTTPQD